MNVYTINDTRLYSLRTHKVIIHFEIFYNNKLSNTVRF